MAPVCPDSVRVEKLPVHTVAGEAVFVPATDPGVTITVAEADTACGQAPLVTATR